MERIQQFAKKNTILYCIIVEIIALGGLLLSGIIIGNVAITTDIYLLQLIQELVAIVINMSLLYVSGLVPVLKHKGAGFGKGILVGMYMLVTAVWAAFGLIAIFLEKNQSAISFRTWYQIVTYVLCMIAIGVSEELLFRGIIATECLRKFGTDNSGIWKAVIVSGMLFGGAHLTNLFSCEAFGVFVQVVVAAFMGMFIAVIYYRSGCIWVTIFLHALQDFCSGITGGLFKGQGTLVDSISNYNLSNLTPAILYFVVVLILLRKKKIREVEKNMGDLVKR